MTAAGRFPGKRALVTGASKGIGHSTAIRLASEGARVALVARQRDALDEAVTEITSAGGERLAFEADCSIEPEIRAAVEQVGSLWGGMDVVISKHPRTDPDLRDRWPARVPMRRMGSADEIASTIAWLASADASYVTGAALVVDGGMSAA